MSGRDGLAVERAENKSSPHEAYVVMICLSPSRDRRDGTAGLSVAVGARAAA
jgi:hypothetical protein